MKLANKVWAKVLDQGHWAVGMSIGCAIVVWNPPSAAIHRALQGCLESTVDAAALVAAGLCASLALFTQFFGSLETKNPERRHFVVDMVRWHRKAIGTLILLVIGSVLLQAACAITDDFGSAARWIAGALVTVAGAAVFSSYLCAMAIFGVLTKPQLYRGPAEQLPSP